MKFAQVLPLLPLAVQAFPAAFEPEVLEKMPQVKSPLKRDLEAGKDPLTVSKGETNCGPTPCLHFNEKDQKVSVTGPYAWQSPAISDIRGPCPGLNAAANHGYLPRSGIASIEETVSGLGALYNMQPELAVFLATYAIALDGNLVEGVWSIGGPLPPDPEFSGLIGTGQGLSYSHNNYEGDSSIGRNDAYLDHGNAHSLNVTRFTEVYNVGGKEDRYTLDKFRQHLIKNQDYSIKYNPYYFTGAFSTIVVVPAAYNFVINFMSNHSAEEPSGYMNGELFKSFFAVSGEPGNFKWNKGQERVPFNWYRRPTGNQYTANDVGEDVAIGYLAYPKTLKIGGNTGKPNSYVGVSVQQLTGGSLNAQTLFQGDNFQCFAFSLAQQAIPDFLKGPLDKLNNASDFLNSAITPITSKLNCPQLGKADQGLFNAYPGKTYNPKGKDTNY